MNTCRGLELTALGLDGPPVQADVVAPFATGRPGIGQREVGAPYAFLLEACSQRHPAGRDVLDTVVELDPRLARTVVVQGQPPGEHPDGSTGNATTSRIGMDGVADLADSQRLRSVSPPADVAHEARIVTFDDGQGRRLSCLEAGSRLDDPRIELVDALRNLDEDRTPELRLLGVVQHLEPPLPVGGHGDPETDALAADHPHPVIVGRVFHSRWSGHLGGPYPSRMSTEPHLLLADGQEHSVAEWEKLAAAVLRKARRLGEDDPDEAVWDELTHSTLDGIEIPPLGTPALVADLPDPVRPPARGDGWDVRALLADPDASASNAAALTDLENGATSLWLQVGASGIDVADLPTVLKGVLLDVAAVVLDAPSDPLAAARAFADAAEGQTLAAGTNLGVDPVGARVRGFETLAGARSSTTEELVQEAASLATDLGCRALVVDGTAVHDLGASDVQELGYVLALGAHYLARPRRRWHQRRRRRRAGRVPAGGQRRAVRDDRQAARRTTPVGPDARAQRRVRGPPQHEPARRDLATDDDQARSLGEHAAHLCRCLRRRCGWRRRSHGASVRLPPRDSGRVRAPDRAQHLDPAGRGVARRQGGRPRRWGVRRREAHRRPRRRRLGGARPDRVRGWCRGRPGGRLPALTDRRGRRRARPPDRHAGPSA